MPAGQVLFVHGFPSSHSAAVMQLWQPGVGVPTQFPALQASPVVQI
jgi:hypothetical protein